MRTLRGFLCFSLVLGIAVLAQEPAPPAAKPSVKSNGAGGSHEGTSELKEHQPTAQEAYSFMGFTLGQSEESTKHLFPIKGKNNQPRCQDAGQGTRHCWVSKENLGPVGLPLLFQLYFVDDKLALIQYDFSSDEYAGMIRSITAKYGAPTDTKSVAFQNGFGASFDSIDCEWINEVSTIVTHQIYNGSRSQSVVSVSDRKLLAEMVKRQPDTDPKI
jgi:hypothetical protein